MEYLAANYNLEKSFIQMAQSLAGKTVVCYGASELGKSALALLQRYGVEVNFFADTYSFGGEFCGLKVLSPAELMDLDRREQVGVLITSALAHEICKSLTVSGLRGDIFAVHNYLLEAADSIPLTEPEINAYLEDVQNIRAKLSDTVSQEIWDALLESRMTFFPFGYVRAFDLSVEASGEYQYFIKEVMELLTKREHVAFIDCGAFNGDTVQVLMDLKIPLLGTYCFEPDAKNFLALCECLKKLQLENCAVAVCSGISYQNEQVSLNANGNMSSRVTVEDTGIIIDAVSLDSFLTDKRVDMIKMDIEGSELDALRGAIKTIQRERPILAVCIYHKFFDFTKIPLFLMENLESYDFLIRHHSGLKETVFYCLPR